MSEQKLCVHTETQAHKGDNQLAERGVADNQNLVIIGMRCPTTQQMFCCFTDIVPRSNIANSSPNNCLCSSSHKSPPQQRLCSCKILGKIVRIPPPGGVASAAQLPAGAP